MLLVIPAIDLSGGRCMQSVRGGESFVYSDDAIEMAKLWRTENARSLHVTDRDGVGEVVRLDVIRRLVESVDIPIEVGGGLASFDAVAAVMDAGVYRAAVSSRVIEDEELSRRLLKAYGPSKVVFGIDAIEGVVDGAPGGPDALQLAQRAKELGFRRLLYTELRRNESLRAVNLHVMRQIGERAGLRITASGGITGLTDLLAVQELEPYGVDSVVVGRALYENKFSCQAVWRLCEAGRYPYTAKV